MGLIEASSHGLFVSLWGLKGLFIFHVQVAQVHTRNFKLALYERVLLEGMLQFPN
jgi:hypothetical protein